MNLKLTSIAAALSIALFGCQNQQTTATSTAKAEQKVENAISEQQYLEQLYREANRVLFQKRVLSATLYGLSSDQVGFEYQGKMESYQPATEAELRASLLALSKKIKNAPLNGASTNDKNTQLVMANLTRYFAGHPDFPIGYIDTWMGLSPFVVNQINGPLIDIPRYMQTDQPLTNEAQAQDYIARLNQFDQLIGSIETKLAADVAQGWIAPKVTLEGALSYLNRFTQSTPAQHPLTTAFAEKVNAISALSTEQKQDLIAQATKAVSEVVYPAYQSIAQATEQLMSNARVESGIWAQPNGAKYYQDAIEQLGDSKLSAEQIHQIGLDEVKRITAEMNSILTSQGYVQGTVGERMVALNDEERFLYPDSEQGRADLLADLNGYIDEITEKMQPLFKTAPSYRVEVRAFSKEVQDGAPGGQYTPPSVDGSKPGIYWINLRDMKANPKFGLKTLTYHEANPGHHWQVALNLEQDSLPFLRRIAPYNAYIEGWALYSEQVAAELGMYQDDPFGDLGRLQAELFRAVRLVVDTGLHHKRWSREQAIDYMAKTTGSAKSDVISEIERYMAWPGQALGYKLGMLKILSMRAHAEAVLGDKFDLGEFHDLILLGGAVPMAVLEQNINDWINSK
ncbi:DUF885 domain-containing protein [Endozoicomonas sp. G2_1]|uniref:DUF885 domain-containing protein n=1 Tax=Endozoicomonas sp. G2_1 TaxID=2821091 RepID=UPI001ADC996E|nr:DUF885 domain-containing protein [Endozoicomonas sp. G2_1]MBO9490754.1 DUF885 domain-containing protein [Endozoicomonas sp. G2_1]